MLVTVDGTSRGTVGGAGLEERVKTLCRDAIRSGEGGVHTFDLARWKPAGLDSLCGGTVTVSISVVRPVPQLVLVGGGHCSLALAQLADVLDWGYTVIDSRAGYATAERFERARAAVTQPPAAWLRESEDLSRFSHVYLMGHSHHEDGDALLALLERGYPGVIGVIGSRAKLHAFRARAREAGIDDRAFERVRCPIGIDIGATTPAEIAVAVAAEVILDIKRGPAAPAPRMEKPSQGSVKP